MSWAKDCVPEIGKLTRLFNGYVEMDPEAKKNGTYCEFRCVYPKTDYYLIFGEWKEISYEPDCDVIETQCKHAKINNGTFYYNMLHIQVYKPLAYTEKRKYKPEVITPRPTVVQVEQTPDFGPDNGNGTRRAPDVHVIVLDSVSHTQFLRSMQKTSTWLSARMEAVQFPHVNKNGLNSRPNGYAMFFGWQGYHIEASPMNDEYIPPRDLWALGGIYLDHEPFVGFEYREKKYRTMMAEDWGKGVFNWPGNYGFQQQPTNHYLRPFHLRIEPPHDKEKEMTNNVYTKSCKEAHDYIWDYLKDFIDTYENEPKFSISWMSEIAHGSMNGLYRIDDLVYDFFREYEDKLRNAFVFIMGDHGMRFGGVRYTKPGEVEDNNPALFMVLPEHLRYNKNLGNNLKDNSRQLTSHFDFHATLVDIARHGKDMTVHTMDAPDPAIKKPPHLAPHYFTH